MAACLSFDGGRGRGKGRGRGRRRGGGSSSIPPWLPKPIPEDQIEQLKVYVGNLRVSVTDHDLKGAFSHYATVTNAFTVKDKNTHRSKGYGFVTVATPEDVQKLLALKDGDRYINGHAVIIKPAKKKLILPGDYEYVPIPLSDRHFDLGPEDPSLCSIHILVDDVIYKILELLPLKTLIGIERVCRRWQMLIHRLFARRTSLSLSGELFGLCGPLTRSIVGKLLILSGPTLKELRVQNVDYSTKDNILRMIALLCPELASLDVTQTMGINFSNLKALTRRCKNLKTFIAEKCPDFDERSLGEVFLSYPTLECLNIGGWFYEGRCFNNLPTTLKVLKISLCHSIKQEHLMFIGNRCNMLEVLNMCHITPTKSVLEHIGTSCQLLTELKVSITSNHSAQGLLVFKNLKVLEVDAECYFEIFPVIEHMKHLEDLTLKAGCENMTCSKKLDFGVFKNLKRVLLCRIRLESLKTLTKCPNLRKLQSRSCHDMTISMFLDILRGCPVLGEFSCADLTLTSEVMKDVSEIMKSRTGPLALAMPLTAQLTEEDYDTKKIKVDRVSSFKFLISGDTDEDDDDEDFDYDDDSLYSGGSLDEYWMYGYCSDNSLPDDFDYYDHFDFLEHHLGLFEIGLDEDVMPYLFD